MRILITNPDTLGDLILRQPLFTALLDHGHEVCLALRRTYSLIAPYLDSRLHVLTFDIDPYHPDIAQRKNDFRSLLLQLSDYAPDCVVIAPYQRTLLDEWIAEALPGARTVALSGYLYNNVIRSFPDTNLRVTSVVYCPEEAHEVEKNRRLASEILCQDVQLDAPKLSCSDGILDMATDYVARLGLTPGAYFVSNIAGFANIAIKSYGISEWRRLFEHMFSEYNSQILLTGIGNEEDYIENFMQSLGTYRYQITKWIGNPSNMDLLIGLIGLSFGYVGHDTGTMHAAAALGKPIFALFGGGTWPRFLPRCTRGIVTTLALPCFGCRWNCHFGDAPCVKDIPIAEVLKSLDLFLTSELEGLTINKLRPDDVRVARLWQEARKRYFDKAFALHETSRSLLGKEQALQERDRLIGEKDQALQERDRLIGEKEQALQERDRLIGEKEQALQERDRLIGEKDRALQERDRLIGEKDQALQEGDRLIEERDQVLQNLARASNDQQRTIQESLQAVQNLEQTVAILSTGRQAVRTVVKAVLLKLRLGFVIRAYRKVVRRQDRR
jgi:ADP-heptose:LPS heptosyltransferase